MAVNPTAALRTVARPAGACPRRALERARALATQADDSLIRSYALRHMGIVEHRAGHLGKRVATWRSHRGCPVGSDSVRGVAANLVGLAYLAAVEGRDEEVPAILEEADCLASGSDAAGITRQIEDARRGLTR